MAAHPGPRRTSKFASRSGVKMPEFKLLGISGPAVGLFIRKFRFLHGDCSHFNKMRHSPRRTARAKFLQSIRFGSRPVRCGGQRSLAPLLRHFLRAMVPFAACVTDAHFPKHFAAFRSRLAAGRVFSCAFMGRRIGNCLRFFLGAKGRPLRLKLRDFPQVQRKGQGKSM